MVNLYVQYYKDANPQRQQELNHCIVHNLQSNKFASVTVIADPDSGCPYTFVPFRGRPTYNDLFKIINERTGDSDINILANTDLILHSSPTDFSQMHPNRVWCLTRWEPKEGTIELWDRTDTQDVWAWRGKMKEIPQADFPLGVPGCDNRIAYLFQEAGYFVENPSRTIRWVHIHESGIRNYTQEDRVQPPYKLLHPHHLNWIEQLPYITGQSGSSQYSESSILKYVFENIGGEWRYFIDLGAGAYDGKMSNTRDLFNEGWKGFGVDVNPSQDRYVVNEFIRPDTVCELIKQYLRCSQIDLLSLDIDSSDFWVLKNILEGGYKPRVILTEFNGCLPADKSMVLKYEPDYMWDGTTKYGYSFLAGKRLLERNGYTVVLNQSEVNILAIRNDYINSHVPEVKSKQTVYHPWNESAVWEEYQ